VDVSLKGYEHGMDVFEAGRKVENPLGVVSAFLKRYDTAKIVFILDTHCGDNGRFVYTGRRPEQYKMCSLIEVTLAAVLRSPKTNIHTDPP
jgi:hypothetical protein